MFKCYLTEKGRTMTIQPKKTLRQLLEAILEALVTKQVEQLPSKRNQPVGYLFALADKKLVEMFQETKAFDLHNAQDDLYRMLRHWNTGITVEKFIAGNLPSSLTKWTADGILHKRKGETESSKMDRAALLIHALESVGLWEP